MALKSLHECCVLVTATSFGQDDPSLHLELESRVGQVRYNPQRRPLKSTELQRLIQDVDGLIAGLDEIDAAVIESAPALKIIARYGVGFDRVDLPAATRLGVMVTNTPGANSTAVAELTIGLLLALARKLCQADGAVHNGEWPRLSGIGLHGKTAGLVGLGAIGRLVAVRLAAFGCWVLAYDPYINSDVSISCGATLVSLDELLERSDFISLHAPVTPDTRGLVNEGFLRKLKPGALLINTARGELIDEADLFNALKGGRLAGAGLDCFIQEPPAAGHPLLTLSNVLLTPHTGSHTDEATSNMGRMALEACLTALSGKRPNYLVNPAVFEYGVRIG
jgi:D-3-phosphoglycerate dehydrogenase / 2-oxoglutarate reductase